MEKSLEQLKQIERLSKQTRHHRTHLNQICDTNLRTELNQLADRREHYLLRSSARRQLEEERKSLVNVTITQIARERQARPVSVRAPPVVQETVQPLTKEKESRPSSSVRLPSTGKSCQLFSHNCQLYPCQPVHQYTSFIRKENDVTLRKRNPTPDDASDAPAKPHLQDLLTRIQEKKYQQNRRQLATAIQNQHHLVNRHVSMQRTMARLDEQSRLLHERLAEKKNFGYVKERQQQLSHAIQRHLGITAKFCA